MVFNLSRFAGCPRFGVGFEWFGSVWTVGGADIAAVMKGCSLSFSVWSISSLLSSSGGAVAGRVEGMSGEGAGVVCSG